MFVKDINLTVELFLTIEELFLSWNNWKSIGLGLSQVNSFGTYSYLLLVFICVCCGQ